MTAINSNRAIRGPVTAVPVVAGKGVRLVADTENNRIVAEADETVLWEGTPTSVTSAIPLSETISNFEKLSVYAEWTFNTDTKVPVFVVIPSSIGKFSLHGTSPSITTQQASEMQVYSVGGVYSASGTSVTPINVFRYQLVNSGGTCTVGNWSTSDTLKILKVVGINRVASN